MLIGSGLRVFALIPCCARLQLNSFLSQFVAEKGRIVKELLSSETRCLPPAPSWTAAGLLNEVSHALWPDFPCFRSHIEPLSPLPNDFRFSKENASGRNIDGAEHQSVSACAGGGGQSPPEPIEYCCLPAIRFRSSSDRSEHVASRTGRVKPKNFKRPEAPGA